MRDAIAHVGLMMPPRAPTYLLWGSRISLPVEVIRSRNISICAQHRQLTQSSRTLAASNGQSRDYIPADPPRSNPQTNLTLLRGALHNAQDELTTSPTGIEPRKSPPAACHDMEGTRLKGGHPTRQRNQPPCGNPTFERAEDLETIIHAFNALIASASCDHDKDRARLAQAISRCRLLSPSIGSGRPESRSYEVMKRFNILVSTIRRHGHALGPELCDIGTGLAAETASWTALRGFLEECKVEGYLVPCPTLQLVVDSLLRHAARKDTNGLRFGAWQKRDAMEILTGWNSSGIGGEGEERQISIASFIAFDDVELIRMYVSALQSLRACAAITHSWRDWKAWSAEQTARRKRTQQMASIYAKALAKAGDRAGASQLLAELGLDTDERRKMANAVFGRGPKYRSELEASWPEAFAGIRKSQDEVLSQLEAILGVGGSQTLTRSASR